MRLRERDIRPPDILAEYLRLNAEDGQRLLEQAGTLERRSCPGCNANNPQPAFKKNGYSLVHCGDCKSLYVERTPSDEAFEAFYQDSPSANYWADTFFPSVSEARREAIFQPRAAKVANILAYYGMRLNVAIDVGAGAGLFLDEFGKLIPDADLRAVEPSAILSRANRNLNRQVFEGYAAAAAIDPAWRASGDLVTCFEVIEHIVDVDAFIASLRDLCRPGGIIIISGLCGTGFDIRVLGEYSNPVSPPHHLTFLSRKGVETLIARLGLELLSFITPGVLDVDIVRNAVLREPGAVTDNFVRDLVLNENEETRAAFQNFLTENELSSHMWIVARRPG